MNFLKMVMLVSFMLALNGCAKEPVNHDYEALLTKYWPTAWPHGCSGIAAYIEKQKAPKSISFTKASRLYLEAICFTLDIESACTGQQGQTFVIGQKQEAQCVGKPMAQKQQNRKKEPEKLFKQAYQLDNTDKHGLAHYAELVYGQDTTEYSLKVQKQAILANPEDTELLTNLAESYVEFEEPKSAIYTYKKVIKIASTVKNNKALAQSYYEIADIYYDQEDYDVALTYLKKGLKSAKPSFVALFNLMGMTYNKLGQNDKAVAMSQRAIKNDKSYWQAYNNLGHALNDQKKFKEAIAVLNSGLKGDREKEVHDLLYYNLAISYHKTDCKQALKYLQLAVKNNVLTQQSQSIQDGVQYHFGRCYVLTKFYDKAITYLKKESNLTDASYYFLGRAYLGKKDYRQAVEYFEQVQEVDEKPHLEDLLAIARKRLEAQE